MFLAPEIFFGCAPKILDRHYAIGPSTDHRAEFHAGRPTHLGYLALKINKKIKKTSEVKLKSSQKLSSPGRLTSDKTFKLIQKYKLMQLGDL